MIFTWISIYYITQIEFNYHANFIVRTIASTIEARAYDINRFKALGCTRFVKIITISCF